jgi:hypothetical protein
VAYDPKHYQANKERIDAKNKAWALANKERTKENRRRNYLLNKERDLKYSTEYNRLRKTGVTPEQYNAKMEEQAGLCAICNKECTKALAADHDHETGKFRGLLCNNCNRGLGHFKDDSMLLLRALYYLEKN